MSSRSDINDQASQFEQEMIASQIAKIQELANQRELQSTGVCLLETCADDLVKPGQLFCDNHCAEIYEKQKRINFS